MLNPEEPITDQEVVDPGPDPLREMLLAEMNQIPVLVQSNNQLQRQRVFEMDEQRRSLLRRLSDLRNRRINKNIDDDEDGENEDPYQDQEHSLGDKLHLKLFTPEDLNQNFLKRREKVSNTVFKKDENHIELCTEEKAPKIVMRRSRSSNSWSIRSSQDQDTRVEEEEDEEYIPKIYMKRIGSSDSWAITN